MRRWTATLLVLILAAFTSSCALAPAGFTSPGNPNPPPDDTMLTVSPATVTLRTGASQTFTSSITNEPLTWSVGGIAGGNAALGTISTSGVYTAPAVLPAPNSVTVSAAETAKTSVTGSSAVTLLNQVAQISSVSPNSFTVGAITVTITGSNFVAGATVSFGSNTLTVTSLSATQIVATGTATAGEVGSVSISVTNPQSGGPSNLLSAQVVGGPTIAANIAARFLQQTTFGPTPALIQQVQATGLQGYLDQQFALPVTQVPAPVAGETGMNETQRRWYLTNLTAQDQLRQRVAFALAQIFVIGGDKVSDPTAYTVWLRLLQNDAFTNYRQIMNDATISPAMGDWLDMVNNGKPKNGNDHANENYARELMQLFTIGTAMLNADGSVQTDGTGAPIPTYAQQQVQEFALAYTGWTFPPKPGAASQTYNPSYWIGSMVGVDSNHDQTAKQLLTYSGAANGGLLPAGQSAQQDLKGALDNIFNHPNIGPFVCRELIQHLVTSNPSPAYITRVAAVFDNNGKGVRGDMKSVITAILMDSEARRGDDPATAVPTDGHLQEPVLYITGLLRALNATTDAQSLGYYGSTMGQNALLSPSVFNYYSPNYVIPQTSMYGPEFQILTTSTSLYRVNWANSLVFGSIGQTTTIDFTPWTQKASNLNTLVADLNTLMLHGTMSSDMQTAIMTALQAVPAGSKLTSLQAQTAIYLIATSSQYQVQR